MRLKNMVGVACVVCAAMASSAADTSVPIFIYARPAAMSFWHTAERANITLPIDFPAGATSASLRVQGVDYDETYEGITSSSFALTLPQAPDLTKENVYELTLTFDEGTIQTARLGLLMESGAAAESITRVVLNTASPKWGVAYRHSVIPIPAGTTSFTVNGASIEEGSAGFTGAQGWYALQNLAIGSTATLSLTANAETLERALKIIRNPPGMTLYVK